MLLNTGYFFKNMGNDNWTILALKGRLAKNKSLTAHPGLTNLGPSHL